MSNNILNYYSFSGSFPLTLKPGQKSNIDVCFESKDQVNRLDTMYVSNSCINRPLIEFTIRTYDDTYDPVIVSESDSCNSCFSLSITDSTINIFNQFVDIIQKKIDEYFNKKSEIELTRSGLVDFGEFFDIKYDVDSEEQVYPDVYTEIERGSEEKDKKKGKFPGKIPGEITKQ
jgi:hypothetical protein